MIKNYKIIKHFVKYKYIEIYRTFLYLNENIDTVYFFYLL